MRKFSMIRAWMLLSVLCLTACATAATSNSALVKAVVFNDTKSIAQALKAGVDPNSTDEKGNPLLVIAMREKSVDVARLLIDDKRTDLDATNAAGENAMMIASLCARISAMRRSHSALSCGQCWPVDTQSFPSTTGSFHSSKAIRPSPP